MIRWIWENGQKNCSNDQNFLVRNKCCFDHILVTLVRKESSFWSDFLDNKQNNNTNCCEINFFLSEIILKSFRLKTQMIVYVGCCVELCFLLLSLLPSFNLFAFILKISQKLYDNIFTVQNVLFLISSKLTIFFFRFISPNLSKILVF